eukprot:7387834-Prymnesium_polylepis.1
MNARTWRDEWIALSTEQYRLIGKKDKEGRSPEDPGWAIEVESPEELLSTFGATIKKSVKIGMPLE